MRYDAEHKQKTRERVIEEAAREIRAQGPDRVGVAEVMAKAGLTHGGFYAHFASKEDLIQAALGRIFEDSRARITRTLSEQPPADGLVAYIDFYLSKGHRDARHSGCGIAALASDLPRQPEAMQAMFAERVGFLTARIAEALTQLGRPEPEVEASSVIAELIGALSIARTEPDPVRSDAILDRSKRMLKQRLGLEALGLETLP